MNSNLDFISTKSGVRTRGMTTAVDSEVKYKFFLMVPWCPVAPSWMIRWPLTESIHNDFLSNN